MNIELDRIAQTVHNRLQKYALKGRTITLKIKFSDFTQITRSHSYINPITEIDKIREIAKLLLASAGIGNRKVRLLGITLSNFGEKHNPIKRQDKTGQLSLFD